MLFIWFTGDCLLLCTRIGSCCPFITFELISCCVGGGGGGGGRVSRVRDFEWFGVPALSWLLLSRDIVCEGVDGPEDGADPGPDGGAGGGCEGLDVIEAVLRVGVDCCWDCGPAIMSVNKEEKKFSPIIAFFNRFVIELSSYLKILWTLLLWILKAIQTIKW